MALRLLAVVRNASPRWRIHSLPFLNQVGNIGSEASVVKNFRMAIRKSKVDLDIL